MPDNKQTVGLGTTATRGVLWLGGGQVFRQIVQVIGSIALARFLSPDDFGLLGMALFFVGVGQLFAEFGIGAAIIQAQAHDRIVLSSCFWINLALAVTVAGVVAVCAPWIAQFYDRPDLSMIVVALAGNLILSALIVIPSTLLTRDLRFGEIARANVFASVLGALTAIGMAWAGAGVWALVAQPLVGSAAVAAALSLAARWIPTAEFSWSSVAPYARFGATLFASNLVTYANRNVDRLLVGRFIGAAPLGIYTMAMQLMLYPLQHVSGVIVRVLFPTLSRLKGDLERLRRAYLQATGAIALITFPLLAGLFAVSADFVHVVFGASWLEMIPILQVLTWVGMAQSVATTVGTIYLSTGRMDVALRVSLIQSPILVGGMVLGMPWGIYGVAVGYSVASILVFHFVAWRACRLIDLSLLRFYAVLYRPLIASLTMVLAVLLMQRWLQGASHTARLLLCIPLGAVVYVAASLVANRRQLGEVTETLLEATGRRWQAGRLIRR